MQNLRLWWLEHEIPQLALVDGANFEIDPLRRRGRLDAERRRRLIVCPGNAAADTIAGLARHQETVARDREGTGRRVRVRRGRRTNRGGVPSTAAASSIFRCWTFSVSVAPATDNPSKQMPMSNAQTSPKLVA